MQTWVARLFASQTSHPLDYSPPQNFERVFIAPDLTKKQQKEDKDLRDQVKTFREQSKDQKDQGVTIKIKAGMVVENVMGKQDVVLYDPKK